jgi:hypothetical protein
MPDGPSELSNPGVRLSSADRFQMSGEIDTTLLAGVEALLLMAGGMVVGQMKPSGLEGPASAFRIPVKDGGPVREGEALRLAAWKGGEVLPLGSLPVRTRLAGALDRCNESLVRGWAANLNCPDLPLDVEILVNDEPRGFAVANRSRSDLQHLEKRLAATGFLFKFQPLVDISAVAPIQVTARVRGTEFALVNSPWWIRRTYNSLPILTATDQA